MRLFILTLFLTITALSPCLAQDTMRIAAFGDSLFSGLGVKPEDAFPAQLESKLNFDGYHVQVINDGITGDTTAGGLARIDRVLAQKPELVLVELGANDMLRGLPPAQVRANLERILQRFKDAHIRILVVGEKAPLSFGLKYGEDYNSIFCELAKQYSGGCYPVYLEGAYNHPDLMQPDGMHPNSDGVKVILGKIYPYVTPYLTK